MDKKVIVAFDFPDTKQAISLSERLDSDHCRIKVGKELFVTGGPQLVSYLIDQGYDVFLDLKFHDIPNTAAAACVKAASMGVWMMNIHAGGGKEMMSECVERLDKCSHRPLLSAVTVLTSLNAKDMSETYGVPINVKDTVRSMARAAGECGVDGIICSPLETEMVLDVNQDLIVTNPGIRPEGSAANDQKRFTTPLQAINAGASYVVIGRPITQADDPVAVLNKINQSLS